MVPKVKGESSGRAGADGSRLVGDLRASVGAAGQS